VIKTYLLARKNLKEPSIFSEELIKTYIAIGDFKNGSNEIIASLDNNRSISGAQGRLYALMATEEGLKYIGKYLEDLANSNSKNLTYQELLAWYYNTNKNFDGAFEVFKRLDDLRNSKGSTIYRFAEDARKDENFQPAITAYEYIIDNSKKYKKYFRSSLFGYAKCLESGLSKSGNISAEQIEEIIDRYEDIIADDPKSNLAEESYYRIGKIYKDISMNYEKAEEFFHNLINIFKNTNKAALSGLEIGEMYLLNGDLNKAQEKFYYVTDNFSKKVQGPKNTASFNLALTYFYSGNSTKALEILQPLIGVQNQNIANDALELTYLIADNKDLPAAIDSLGVARFFAFKAKSAEDTLNADLKFRNIHKAFPATPAAELAFKDLAKMYFDQSPAKTIEVIDQFLYLYPTSILVDEILMIKGKCYESIGDLSEAQSIYSKLLVEHPNSIYLQEARDSIRRLRGEL
jgi:tetratricopeptide (TPR) repeat protein